MLWIFHMPGKGESEAVIFMCINILRKILLEFTKVRC